jgi:peptide/nickel transport system permease protein
MLFTRFKKIISLKNPIFWALITLISIALWGDKLAHEPKTNTFPPLIPFAASSQDKSENANFLSPFAHQNTTLYQRHWLGTDGIGRDITAGLINGTKTALAVGFGGMFLAFLIGVPLGLMAGFWGDNRLEMPILSFILRGSLFFILIFYLNIFLHLNDSTASIFIKLTVIILFFELVIKSLEAILSKLNISNRTIVIPFDLIIMRVVEVIQAVPMILWILGALSIIGVHQLTITGFILLIGLTSWIGFTRLVRGETLRIRSLEYMEAAAVMGASESRQMLKHALPNVLTPALVALSFGIANAILLEALLSFIGLGLPADMVSWGTLLQAARANFECWWLAIFPGLAIFFTVYTFNRLGEMLSDN